MNAEEYFEKEDLMNNKEYLLEDVDDWFFSKSDMIKFAEEYHQSKLREELIEFADFVDDKVLEMVKVQRPVELVDEYLNSKHNG